jgi:N-acyl-D-aspartate/D-glutamate deacylase
MFAMKGGKPSGTNDEKTSQALAGTDVVKAGLSDQGTIEPRMRADLVLLDASPLQNIDNTRRIRMVVAAGRLFERKVLDAMLLDIEGVARRWAGDPTGR